MNGAEFTSQLAKQRKNVDNRQLADTAIAAETGKPHILVLNQHGDNRGDEAALRAMVESFQDHLGDVRFTILHQFADRNLRPRLDAEVEWHSLVLRPTQGLALLAAALMRPWGLAKRASGHGTVARIRSAYESADLVINAPGGPYFGDIYAGHEIVHWFYVWIAGRYGKPTFHYATSAGPFQNRWLNPIRKWFFRRIDKVFIREEVSADLLKNLVPGLQIQVTADSALQRTPPTPELVAERKTARKGRLVLGASARMHQFPDAQSAAERTRLQANYLDVLERTIRHAAKRGAEKLVLFPQLYGAAHSDVGFLNELGARIDDAISWEIFDPEADSDQQRDAIGDCDVFVASRYHPQIFAASQGVPGLCFAYEHKMTGFMAQLGTERFAFPIDDLNADKVINALDELFDNRDSIGAQMLEGATRLKEVSGRTTKAAVELLQQRARVLQ